jgi:lipoyl-dependent peroxiredoxin
MAQLAERTEARSNVIYTAKTHTTGGRENGHARSSDGQLEVRLSTPGSGRPGTNPEQLFAAGWSACFEGALAFLAQKKKIKLPPETAIDAEVDLHLDKGEFFLSARLNISIPGIERSVAEELVEAASHVCPYSKATKGNIDVTYTLV